MNQLNENIHKLLELWLNGSTSVKEEEQLRNYFNKGHVAPDLEKYRSLFVHFSEERKLTTPALDLENFLNQHQKEAKTIRIKRLLYSTSAVAAVLLTLFVWTKIFKDPPPPPPSTQPSAEEVIKAYAETARVLGLISEKFNAGMKPMGHLAKIGESGDKLKVFEQIGKGMELLNHIMPGRKQENETKSENSSNEKI
jgi:hypothetical protein